MDTASDILRSLSPADIRHRLTELDAEQRALRTLLRAALRIEAGKQQVSNEQRNPND